eukprot:133180-Pleurochrysis_carterae.AAC.3
MSQSGRNDRQSVGSDGQLRLMLKGTRRATEIKALCSRAHSHALCPDNVLNRAGVCEIDVHATLHVDVPAHVSVLLCYPESSRSLASTQRRRSRRVVGRRRAGRREPRASVFYKGCSWLP